MSLVKESNVSQFIDTVKVINMVVRTIVLLG